MFIYRDDYYNPDTSDAPNLAEVNVAKHRNGETGMATLYMHKQIMRFANSQRKTVEL